MKKLPKIFKDGQILLFAHHLRRLADAEGDKKTTAYEKMSSFLQNDYVISSTPYHYAMFVAYTADNILQNIVSVPPMGPAKINKERLEILENLLLSPTVASATHSSYCEIEKKDGSDKKQDISIEINQTLNDLDMLRTCANDQDNSTETIRIRQMYADNNKDLYQWPVIDFVKKRADYKIKPLKDRLGF